MASGLYDKAREGFLNGDIDWTNDTIKAILIDTADYTVNFAADDNLDDVPSGARVAISNALSSKTATNGVADAANLTLAAVTGDSVEAIVLFKDTGSEASSSLIAYIDTSGATITPNGSDVTVVWDDGASKIFKL